MGVRDSQRLAHHVEENLGHWGCEGHKKGGKPGHYASLGKEMQKTKQWQIHSRSCTPTTGCASTEKMVYWYCSSNTFGFQLFDH